MIKKTINIPKDEEFEIIDGLFIYGIFEIEYFEKNYGTFQEDINIRSNFNCIELYINGNRNDLYSLSNIQIEDLKQYIEGLAKRKY